jgi:glycosyl hydrolase group 75 (putative chitosanase)
MKACLPVVCAALLLIGCGSGSVADDDDDDDDVVAPDGSTPGQPDGSVGPDVDGSIDPGEPDAAPGDDLAAELLGLVGACDNAHISICGLNGAVFWKADLDVDCDGIETEVCNAQTDGSYQNQTSAQTSTGDWLDASTLPYVVIPLPSDRWDYATADIDLGTVVAVIYQGHVEFGVFGDQGPREIIGEASYRMAQLLGIDPDPNTGGTDDEVVFIAFTGGDARVEIMEDHGEAVAIGEAQAAELLADNP